ncbi:MAG TPA: hypothetical protein VN714_23460 [Trebonia sp.]|nr:hypothetical protein [Trebonia sp.]
MPVNLGFAHASNDFLIAALLIYSLAVLAFAGDYAFGRPRRAASAAGVRTGARAGARLATVGAGQATAGIDEAGLDTSGLDTGEPGADGSQSDVEASHGGQGTVTPAAPARSLPVPPTGAFRAMWEAGPWGRAAVALSAVGMLAHLGAVVTRGLAVHRAPWGNMYEFITAPSSGRTATPYGSAAVTAPRDGRPGCPPAAG